MSRTLEILSCGPAVTVQDGGRPGWIAQGLSRGGAMDVAALADARALLGHDGAALEMGGFGGQFRVDAPSRFALTGAPMRARLDGAALVWGASHAIEPGQVLEIGPVVSGAYGYLSFGGGIATEPFMGSRSAHLIAGIGARLQAGDMLALGEDPGGDVGMVLPDASAQGGATLRVVASAQTALFPAAKVAAFCGTAFIRAPRGNRQGVALEGAAFESGAGLSLVSETIAPGDIQITGDGTPYILMAECQTTGGYPRLATVIPPDLPKVAQLAPGAPVRFEMLSNAEAIAAMRADLAERAARDAALEPLLRDPGEMSDLLSYSLISGAITGWDE